MNAPALLAAGLVDPFGFGASASGWTEWPTGIREAIRRGEVDPVRWSLVSDSDPARFARMDWMCRLGMMAAELLAPAWAGLDDAVRERTAVCVETSVGCLDTDVRFARAPRPSLFAYTLPSTVMGEICIRHRLQGPMVCLVSMRAEGRQALGQALDWLAGAEADVCLCLACDAVDPGHAEAGRLSGIGLPEAWRAAAVLLGRGDARTGGADLDGVDLMELAARACGRPETT